MSPVDVRRARREVPVDLGQQRCDLGLELGESLVDLTVSVGAGCWHPKSGAGMGVSGVGGRVGSAMSGPPWGLPRPGVPLAGASVVRMIVRKNRRYACGRPSAIPAWTVGRA